MLLSVLQEWHFITNMYLKWLITYIFLVNVKKNIAKRFLFRIFIYIFVAVFYAIRYS